MGPCPMVKHGLARLQAQGFDPFHAGIYRLYEASLLKGDCFGDLHRSLVDDPIHDANVFREASAGRLEAGSASDLSCRSDTGRRSCAGSSNTRGRGCDETPRPGRRARTCSRPRLPPPLRRRFRGRRCGAAEWEPEAIFFRSVPQTPQVCTRRSSSPAPISGTGTVSRRTSLTPR